jgi:hypothetical protein
MGDPITVTAWNTPPSQEHPEAQYHDCLWEIAVEQATLDRMRNGEDFNTAMTKITPEETVKHLDTICGDNGFRRLDGGGGGRNPNLIYDGEKIKVRVDPATLTKPAAGVNDKPSGTAYTKAVQNDAGTGVDLNKKTQLDEWLKSVPGFETQPENPKAALLDTYQREGMDRTKLAQLAGAGAFNNLDDGTKIRLLQLYGQKDQPSITAEINKLLDKPVVGAKERLVLIGAAGFPKLNATRQALLFERYDKDPHFQAAINAIVTQPNFTDKSDVAQAHALDILYRYAGRKHAGYGAKHEHDRKLTLVTLYNKILSDLDFKLEANGGGGKPENFDQSRRIDVFVKHIAPDIKEK